jgi:hypothetical protein
VRGLEHLQQSSRKHALEVLLEELDGEYQTALAEFNTGVSARVFSIYSLHLLSFIANGVYVREKERCKELLDISKAKLDEVDEELRNTFKGMEEVRRHRISTGCRLVC